MQRDFKGVEFRLSSQWNRWDVVGTYPVLMSIYQVLGSTQHTLSHFAWAMEQHKPHASEQNELVFQPGIKSKLRILVSIPCLCALLPVSKEDVGCDLPSSIMSYVQLVIGNKILLCVLG